MGATVAACLPHDWPSGPSPQHTPLPSDSGCGNGCNEIEMHTFAFLITRAPSTNDLFNQQVVFKKSHRHLGTQWCSVDKLRFGGLGLAGPEFKS